VIARPGMQDGDADTDRDENPASSLASSTAGRDLFDQLVASTKDAPANAYLLVGGESTARLAARRLAAALMATEGKLQELILRGAHPDIVECEGEGAGGYLMEQIEGTVLTQASQAPLEARRKIIVLYGAESLGARPAGVLLKTVEEPLPTTGFVFCTSDEAAVLETIRSRCITIFLPAVSTVDASQALAADYACPAEEAAQLLRATGSIDWVKSLLSDPEETARFLRWRWLPLRLQNSPATSLVQEIFQDFAQSGEGLEAKQTEEVTRFTEYLGTGRARSRQAALRSVEERHKRARRRQSVLLYRQFLSALRIHYRDVLAVATGAPLLCEKLATEFEQGEKEGTPLEGIAERSASAALAAQAERLGVGGALQALRVVGEGLAAFRWNVHAELVIEGVLLDLAVLGDRAA